MKFQKSTNQLSRSDPVASLTALMGQPSVLVLVVWLVTLG